jgi:hypothetical protein
MSFHPTLRSHRCYYKPCVPPLRFSLLLNRKWTPAWKCYLSKSACSRPSSHGNVTSLKLEWINTCIKIFHNKLNYKYLSKLNLSYLLVPKVCACNINIWNNYNLVGSWYPTYATTTFNLFRNLLAMQSQIVLSVDMD